LIDGKDDLHISRIKKQSTVLQHWYHTVTYQKLSVKEIRNSVENADTLNLLNIEYGPIENVCDLDFDIM